MQTPQVPRSFASGGRRACALCRARQQLKTRPGPAGSPPGRRVPETRRRWKCSLPVPVDVRRGRGDIPEGREEVRREGTLGDSGTGRKSRGPRTWPPTRPPTRPHTRPRTWPRTRPPSCSRGPTPATSRKPCFAHARGACQGFSREGGSWRCSPVHVQFFTPPLFFRLHRIHPHGARESESGQWQRPIFSSQTTETRGTRHFRSEVENKDYSLPA